MKQKASRCIQRGVTLVVGLVMLVVITLMVTSAFMLSTSNLKAVANVQFRDEAVAAANVAIEKVVGDLFVGGTKVPPAAQVIPIDLNNDGVTDYQASVASATCVRADPELPSGTSTPGSGSSVTLVLPGGPPITYSTVWEIATNVTDPMSGASVVVRQGVRAKLTEAQKLAACP